MSIYNNIFEKDSEKIDNSSDITQITNNVTKLYLEDNKSHDFFNEIVKEMCNLYNEEISKNRGPDLILDILEQFLIKNKQSPKNIINYCLNNRINPIIQIVIANCYHCGKWVEKDGHM